MMATGAALAARLRVIETRPMGIKPTHSRAAEAGRRLAKLTASGA
jgi:hypothetical protein